MIYYLTGTGNSRWAAQLLADHLHDTAEDAAPAELFTNPKNQHLRDFLGKVLK